MKNLLSKCAVLCGVAIFASAGPAFANVQRFTAVNDYVHTTAGGTLIPGVHLDSTGRTGQKTFSDVFDLTTDGFDPGTDTAFAGVAYFDINDFSNPNLTDTVKIKVGPFDTLSGAPAASYSFTFGLLNLAVLEKINSSGQLGFSVTSQSGTFFLTGASLNVLALVPNPVPDGSATIGLLAFGLLGLGLAGYRLRTT